jgi:uncharacterized protein
VKIGKCFKYDEITMKLKPSEIKKIIQEVFDGFNLNNIKIILFGSRAKNQYAKDSDWDFLIIVEKTLSREEKMEISYQIRKTLAQKHIPCDIIIRSQAEIKEFTSRVNSATKTAIEEGVSF